MTPPVAKGVYSLMLCFDAQAREVGGETDCTAHEEEWARTAESAAASPLSTVDSGKVCDSLSAPATMVRSLQSTYVGNFVCAPTMHNVR
jgi:hypothetical protein